MKRLIVLFVAFALLPFLVQAQQETGRQADEEVKLEILMDSAADSAYLYVVNDVYYIHHLDPGKVLQSIDHGSIDKIAIYNQEDSKELFDAYAEKTGKYGPLLQGIVVLETRNSLLPSALDRRASSLSLMGKSQI